MWRRMLNAREEVEHEIMWEIKSGTTNIWHENWTGLGALYHVLPPDFPINEDLQDVAKLRQGGLWNEQLDDQSFSEDIADHIKHNVHYNGAAGINVPLVQVKQVIRNWWTAKCCPKLKPLFQAVPAIISWEVWKKRNTNKNGGTVSTNKAIHKVNKTLHYLAGVRYLWLSHIPMLWPDMIQFFEAYKPILITRRVTWQLPHQGWYKCNTDGASKGNPRSGSLGFCVRNDVGDLVYARVVDLGVTTNVVAEAKAILQGLEYCVEHDLHPLLLETDSLVLKKTIEGE
ncbi:uncharacterized protein LOC142165958 [Nicotiana tabacum]|uniref:Uncharacterized protein LOC142165958 n=1 Tax=Nicotiana tabacum TaxID=4097 RepID=A0AC58S637_TOBAC